MAAAFAKTTTGVPRASITTLVPFNSLEITVRAGVFRLLRVSVRPVPTLLMAYAVVPTSEMSSWICAWVSPVAAFATPPAAPVVTAVMAFVAAWIAWLIAL